MMVGVTVNKESQFNNNKPLLKDNNTHRGIIYYT